MGEPRLNGNVGARAQSTEEDRHSVPANSLVKPTTGLYRARPTEDDWDDRYGLLPPEPPPVSEREDSVLMALSDLGQPVAQNSNAHKPVYGSFPAAAAAEPAEALFKQRLNMSLSSVAGYVDAAGFLALFGLFPAHLTGELVSAAALSAVPGSAAVWVRLLMAGLFILGVVASVLLARAYTRRGQPALSPQLILLTTCLAIFCTLGCLRPPGSGALDGWTTITAGGAVLAMGVQNAMMRHALVGTLPTTVMTGNLTQFVTELVHLCVGRLTGSNDREHVHASTRRLRVLGRAITCFFGGALLGAWATQTFGLISVALPAAISALLTLLAWRRP